MRRLRDPSAALADAAGRGAGHRGGSVATVAGDDLAGGGAGDRLRHLGAGARPIWRAGATGAYRDLHRDHGARLRLLPRLSAARGHGGVRDRDRHVPGLLPARRRRGAGRHRDQYRAGRDGDPEGVVRFLCRIHRTGTIAGSAAARTTRGGAAERREFQARQYRCADRATQSSSVLRRAGTVDDAAGGRPRRLHDGGAGPRRLQTGQRHLWPQPWRSVADRDRRSIAGHGQRTNHGGAAGRRRIRGDHPRPGRGRHRRGAVHRPGAV